MKDGTVSDPPLNMLPVLDRFVTTIAPLFKKDSPLTEWSIFRQLLSQQPLNYGRIYSQLGRIQRGSSPSEDVAQTKQSKRRYSNAYWDDYSNEYNAPPPIVKKKASSVYKRLQEASTKEPSKYGSNFNAINAEYSLKQQRSHSRYGDSVLKESREQLIPSYSSSRLNRETGPQQNSFSTMGLVDYLKQEGARLPTNKPELMRILTNSSVVVGTRVYEQIPILAVGFFVILLREAYDDSSRINMSIWEVYNRVANRAFTYTNADDCTVFLRVLNRILNKKYSMDARRRCRYFLQQVLSGSMLLHIVERIYKEIIQETKLADGPQSTRKTSYSTSRKEAANKGTTTVAYVENCRDFSRICLLRMYSVRDGNLIFQNYGEEDRSQSRLSLIKKNNLFLLIIEEQSEYAGVLEQTTIRTMESTKSFRNFDSNVRAEDFKEIASPEPAKKRAQRILSNTQSIRKGQHKQPEHHRYERIASKMSAGNAGDRSAEELSLFVVRPDERTILATKLDRLIVRLNSNNSAINGLVKDEQKYQPLKSPLVSLNDVYPLMAQDDSSQRKKHMK